MFWQEFISFILFRSDIPAIDLLLTTGIQHVFRQAEKEVYEITITFFPSISRILQGVQIYTSLSKFFFVVISVIISVDVLK